jgi:hypothetical protein
MDFPLRALCSNEGRELPSPVLLDLFAEELRHRLSLSREKRGILTHAFEWFHLQEKGALPFSFGVNSTEVGSQICTK